MLDSPMLDTAIALVFIYFLLSTLVTGVTELISYILSLRGKMLRFALSEVLNDRHNQNYAERLYDHPALDLFKKKQSSLPERMGAPQFAAALMDLVGAEADIIAFEQDKASGVLIQRVERQADAVARFREGLEEMRYSDLRVLLQGFVDQAGGEAATLEALRARIEEWYNAYMQQVSAWYRQQIRWFVVLASAAVTLALNVDSIHLVQQLYSDKALREPLIAAAIAQVEKGMPDGPDGDVAERVQAIRDQLKGIEAFRLPLGWRIGEGTGAITWQERLSGRRLPGTLLGWAFTVAALTMGAPFWYQALQKLLAMRRAGDKDAKQ